MKNSQLQIRISDAQKHAIQQAASASHMDVSNWVLSKLFKSPKVRFIEKINELVAVASWVSERKFVLADLANFLQGLSSSELQEVFQAQWSIQLDPLLSNYVAAMLELCAHRAQIDAAHWLSQIEPLEKPWLA